MSRDIDRAEELISRARYLLSLPNAEFEIAKALHDAERDGYQQGVDRMRRAASEVCYDRSFAHRDTPLVSDKLRHAAHAINALTPGDL